MALKILITNDDEINALGLKLLVDKISSLNLGEILVVAPKSEQSAKSHALELRKEIQYEELNIFTSIKAYSYDSTPADCVRFAYYGLKYDFDLLLSGVNKGYNVGFDIMYSGTVAAAFEASSYGKKAIAVSCDYNSFEGFNSNYLEVYNYLLTNKLLDNWNLYNINFPLEANGIRITKQGGPIFDTFYLDGENGVIQSGNVCIETRKEFIDNDETCVNNGYISITPLTHERTKFEIYNKLKVLNIK